ncbi:hypothetical protein H9P43_007789 [Blastocladiella emersonii ATCC 22665]|nr:hypothetical protein H9P43_007789 [Blastocladiella emersonii ATCC 22665]
MTVSVVAGHYDPSSELALQRKLTPLDLPVEKLTHVYYVHGAINNDGELDVTDRAVDFDHEYALADGRKVRGNVALFTAADSPLRQRNGGLKAILAVAGPDAAARLVLAAKTADSRAKFAASALHFLAKHKFDGLDLEIEPSATFAAADAENIGRLVKNVREGLDVLSQWHNRATPLSVSVTISGHAAAFAKVDTVELARHAHWINLKTVGLAAKDAKTTEHNAPGGLIQHAVDALVKSGVAADKLIAALPLYGLKFTGVHEAAPHASTDGKAPTVVAADEIEATLPRAMGVLPLYDERAVAAALWHTVRGDWYSIDTVTSVAAKATIARKHGLRGVAFWDLAGDRRGSLIEAGRRAILAL